MFRDVLENCFKISSLLLTVIKRTKIRGYNATRSFGTTPRGKFLSNSAFISRFLVNPMIREAESKYSRLMSDFIDTDDDVNRDDNYR